jgi:hypothetical protein
MTPKGTFILFRSLPLVFLSSWGRASTDDQVVDDQLLTPPGPPTSATASNSRIMATG